MVLESAADPPFALGGFVGRASETAEIPLLLATARLFTLTGPGGSGKTRLAARLATEARATFRDGVRWVDMSALADPALVPNTVAERCGIADRGGVAVLDALVSALRPQHLLLILDNCEHLLMACANLIETMLAACPDLHILVTSREAFGLPGEVIWLVSPLGVPERNDLAIEEALAYGAVELFVARAAAVLPGFRLTLENATSIVRICRRVDGLPLALELAAARLRVLSLVDLAERLDDAMRLLTGGSHTAPARQRTMRAALDWSYQLLPEAERAVFHRLAVFAGIFSLGAAEAVCAGDGVGEVEVLDLLGRLVEKSLVVVQGRQEETRYRLLEPIRQYARERLRAAGDVQEAQRRHCAWCADLAAQAGPELDRQDQVRWLDRLATEHDNVRAALGWSLNQGEAVIAGRIFAPIWSFWLLRGHMHEGRRWAEQILADVADVTPLRAQLHWVAGILARPDAARGQRHFAESLSLWQTLGDRAGVARALGSLGFLAQVTGDHARAVAHLEESLPVVRASNDEHTLARVLIGLGISLLEISDWERALAVCTEGLALHQRLGDARGTAATLANLGMIWQARGDEQRANMLWEESLAIRRRIGDLGGAAHVLALLGLLAHRQGALARGVGLYHESLVLHRRIGEHHRLPPILEGLAAVGAAQDSPGSAAQLAGAADSLRAVLGVPLSPQDRAAHDRTLTILRTRLGAEVFARGWAEGRSLTAGEAIDLALTQAISGDIPVTETAVESPSPRATPAQTYDLTPREREVLRLLTFGQTYAQIAETLAISPRTVDAHVRAIFGKLDVRSRTAATRLALEQHLV